MIKEKVYKTRKSALKDRIPNKTEKKSALQVETN